MLKWEYCILRSGLRNLPYHSITYFENPTQPKNSSSFDAAMKELGLAGWELFWIIGNPEAAAYYYFKRPKP